MRTCTEVSVFNTNSSASISNMVSCWMSGSVVGSCCSHHKAQRKLCFHHFHQTDMILVAYGSASLQCISVCFKKALMSVIALLPFPDRLNQFRCVHMPAWCTNSRRKQMLTWKQESRVEIIFQQMISRNVCFAFKHNSCSDWNNFEGFQVFCGTILNVQIWWLLVLTKSKQFPKLTWMFDRSENLLYFLKYALSCLYW